MIALSSQIAREGACAQARDIPKLQARTIALVNARRVPSPLQETLLSGVNQLTAQAPVCVPRVTPVATGPTVTVPSDHHGHKPKKHGHKHHGHDEGD